MRNDARPIGEEYRDIAGHADRAPAEGHPRPHDREGQLVGSEEPIDLEPLDQPPPAERSER